MAIVTTIYRCAKCGSKNVVPYSAEGEPMKDPLLDILRNKSAKEFRCSAIKHSHQMITIRGEF